MSTKNGSFVFRLFSVFILLTLLCNSIGVTSAHAAGIRYAKPTSSGTSDCSTWANACTLQTALTGAVSGDEIWVMAGTHKPTPGTDRTIAFRLKNGVGVYGGFAGTETARIQRNPAANVTILSGDIDNNDSQTPIITNLLTVTGNTTNSYHVVFVPFVGFGTTGGILDGFTITAGNANDISPYGDRGGGMYNASIDTPALTLTNLTFSGNSAQVGGGMVNDSSNPILTKVTFSANLATADGGGMYNWSSSPTLANVTFSGNSAQYGGGMYNDASSNPTLTNVTFSANSVPTHAAHLGGGMYNTHSSPTLINVTFNANSAFEGGGMFNNFSSSPILTNVTFSGNSASGDGGGLESGSSSNPQIRNAIFWGNTAPNGAQIFSYSSSTVVNDSVIQGGCPSAGSICTNVIVTDPQLGTLGNYGGLTQTFPLQTNSSAIDTGNDFTCATTDQRGIARPQGSHCDIGSYERTINSTFADVPFSYWSWQYVERLYNDGITDGCSSSPLNYCPANPVTRAQMAIFLLRGMHGSAYTPPPATGNKFTDVPLGSFAAAWIEQLATEGITSGCGGGNYCPNTPVTRAQMAIFLVRAHHGIAFVPPTATGIFPDVPVGSFGASYIEQLVADAITSGCGGGNFCPNTMVKRDSMAVFLVKTFNLP